MASYVGIRGQQLPESPAEHYNYFRDYDPSLGRYVESDPIGLKGGINTYGYAGSSPVTLYDSLGLKIEMRCRPVGDPDSPGLRARAAAFLGGEHCFIVVSCNGLTNIPETSVSYLAGGISIAPQGGSHNNDTIYSQQHRYRPLDVRPRDRQTCGAACKIEQCVLQKAQLLQATDYRVPGYSAIFGPNSNSVARRLIEECGGVASGSGPLTGWHSAGSVGF